MKNILYCDSLMSYCFEIFEKHIYYEFCTDNKRQIDLSIHYHSECKNTHLFILGCHIRYKNNMKTDKRKKTK